MMSWPHSRVVDWYNKRRLLERLGHIPPAEAEKAYYASIGNDDRHCCKVSDEAAFCLIQRPYISKTLLTRRISPRGSP
ncbi:hypothetical protein CI641_024785 [Escherichia coli]|nr:hypothetical protein CI641_024785 [Escherichia coli]